MNSTREGRPERLEVFLGIDMLKVAWESGICRGLIIKPTRNFHGSARYSAL